MSAVVRLESLKTFKAEPPSLEELARLMPKKIDFSGIVKDHVGASFLEFQMNPGEYLKKRWSLRIDGKWNKRASRNYLLALYLLSVAGGLLACLNLPQNSNNPDVPINTDPDGDDNQVIGNLCLALETAGAHFAADFSQYADSYLVFNTGDVHSGDLSNLQEQATCFLSGENHSTHVDVTSFLGGLGETPNTLSIIQTFADEHGEIGVNPLWAVSVPDGDPDDNFETFSLFSADKNVAEIDEHGGKVRMRLLPVSVGVDGDISVLEDKEPIFLEKADDFESNYTLTAGDSNPVMLSVKGHGSLSGLGLLSENIERAQEGLDKLKESSVIFGKNPEISAVVGIEPGQADGVKFLENSWEIQDGLNDQGFAPVIVETDDGNILNVTNGSCIPGLPGQLWNPNAVEGKDEFLSLNDLGFTLYGGSDGVRYKAITDLGIDVDNCVNLVVTNSQDLPYGMNFKAGTLVTALINPENGEVLSVIPIVYDMSDDVVITRDELGVTITATDENGIQNIYTLDLSMGVDINITPEVPEEIGEFCQISGCEAELNEEGNYELVFKDTVGGVDQKVRLSQNEEGEYGFDISDDGFSKDWNVGLDQIQYDEEKDEIRAVAAENIEYYLESGVWQRDYQMLVDNAPNQVFWGIARRDGAEYSLDGVFTGEIKTFKVLIGDLGKVEVECIGMTAKDPNDSSILRHFYIPIEVKDERIGVYASSDGNSYPLNYPWFRTLSRLLDKEVFLGKLKPGEQIEFSFIAGSLGLNHIKQYIGALADIDLYYWAYYLAVSQDQGRIIDNMVSGAVEEWPEDFILSGYQYSLFD